MGENHMNRQEMIDILLEENVNGDWTDDYYFEKDNIHMVWCEAVELWLMLNYKTFPKTFESSCTLEEAFKYTFADQLSDEGIKEFLDNIMQDRLNRSYEDYLLGNDDEGYSYTEEGQDIFNEILIEVENFLAKLNVVNESMNFKGERK
jgi:hypothetical protein